MAKNFTFPDVPNRRSYFNEVNRGEPRVADRWQVYNYNSQSRDARWYGNCVECDRPGFLLKDGTLCDSFYNCGLIVLTLTLQVDGKATQVPVRFCYYCAQYEAQIVTGKAKAQVLLDGGAKPKDLGPIKWPEPKAKKDDGDDEPPTPTRRRRTDPIIAA